MGEPKVEIRKLSEFRPLQANPNRHTQRGLKALENSVQKDGWVAPLTVAADGESLDGAARLEVAADKFDDEALVIKHDGTKPIIMVRTDVPDAKSETARRIIYRANRVGQLDLDWDAEQILADMGAGLDLSGLFDDLELGDILGDAFVEAEAGEVPEPQIDKGAELAECYGVKTGQVWELGDHRLTCIDSTDADAVANLMQGKKAKLFATDPPYGANAGNIGYTAQRDDIEAIMKDNLEGAEMQAFLECIFSAWLPHLENNCAWYLWHPMLTQGYFAAAAAADLIISRQIIWKKEQFIFGRGDYHWRHELCFYGWRKGHHPPFYGERNQDTIWEIPYDIKRSEVGHPTVKPIELFAIPMRNHLRSGEICAEPFCGSGSQLLAAEHHGVQCYAADIEPKWVALAIQRWVDLTGKEPKLLP